MTIRLTAYDTAACIPYTNKREAINESLQRAFINGTYEQADGWNILTIVDQSNDGSQILPFGHPFLMKKEKDAPIEDQFLCVDMRPFVRTDRHSMKTIITNEVEYNVALARAQLNYIYISADPAYLRNVSTLPMALYAAWISESIGKRFALDPREQQTIAILAAIFYNSQFTDDVELSDRLKMATLSTIAAATRSSSQDVLNVIDRVSIINDVFDFCQKVQEIVASVRLKDFNAGVLFTILGTTWYGVNAKEVASVAVEHPPTWIAMVLAGAHERTFKNSQIAKLMERSSFSKQVDSFHMSVMKMISVVAGKTK